jgi:hypothetical protein
MSNNTQLNGVSVPNGDSIRTLDKSGVNTQVVALDIGGTGTESLVNGSMPVSGAVAHDAVDSGNPVKIGGKANSTAPAIVQAGDRVDQWNDLFGRIVVSDLDPELNTTTGITTLRDRLVAQRYTVLADSVADGLAGFWTQSIANGGTITTTGGEGLLQTSANATGSSQLVSPAPAYFPGQSTWLNSAIRFGDTGSAGNVRRVGACTVSGTTPQDGFYFELNSTGISAVVVKAGVATSTPSASWSRAASAPFTVDTNYNSLEIRWTANRVDFYVNNSVRHTVIGTNTTLTSTLNFPILLQNINSSGATDRLLAVRNIGVGRFGTPPNDTSATQVARVLFSANYNATNAAVADTLLTTLVVNRAGIATTGQTSIAVTAGKTLRLTSVILSLRTTTLALPFGTLTLRMNPTGAAVLASPVVSQFSISGNAAAAGNTGSLSFDLGDEGMEFSGLQQIGFSFSNNVNTNVTSVSVIGYEYTTPA